MGQKKGKVTHLNVGQCEHGPFALVCMVTHIFYTLQLCHISPTHHYHHHLHHYHHHHCLQRDYFHHHHCHHHTFNMTTIITNLNRDMPTTTTTRPTRQQGAQDALCLKPQICFSSFFYFITITTNSFITGTFTIHHPPFTITTPQKQQHANTLKTCPP